MEAHRTTAPPLVPRRIVVLDLEVSPDPVAGRLLNARAQAVSSSWTTSRIDVATVLVARPVASSQDGRWRVTDLVTFDAEPGSEHATGDEVDLLHQVARLLGDAAATPANPKTSWLVTYNGEAFDLPILRMRAMRHGLFGLRDLLSQSRFHSVDMLRRLTRPHGARPPKLREVAAGLRIPGTPDTRRSPMAPNGKRAAKCEVDVCATFLVHAHELAAATGDGRVVDAQWRALADFIGRDRFVPGHLSQFSRHPRFISDENIDENLLRSLGLTGRDEG